MKKYLLRMTEEEYAKIKKLASIKHRSMKATILKCIEEELIAENLRSQEQKAMTTIDKY